MISNPGAQSVVVELGDGKAIQASLRASTRRWRELHSRWDELLQKYPDQWIAYYDGDVAVGKTLEQLLVTMDMRGFPRGETPIEFMETEPMEMIL